MYVSDWTVGFVLGLIIGAGGLITLALLLKGKTK